MADDALLKQLADKELGEDDIRKLLGSDVKIITYPQLERETPETVFDGKGRCVILYLTESANEGHWIGLIKQKDGSIEYFDSFGLKPDGEAHWLSAKERVALHETQPLLHKLLSGTKWYSNPKKLQKDSSSTCGRHVCWRMLNPGPLSQYVNTLVGSGNPDRYVCEKTYAIIHK